MKRYRRQYLWYLSFVTLKAAAEVLIDEQAAILSSQQIAENVDRYLASLQGRGKIRIQAAFCALCFWPIFRALPPLPLMDARARREYLERRFVAGIANRRGWRVVRPLAEAAVRVASQFTYLGYYGDERTWNSVGYTRFTGRPGGRPPNAKGSVPGLLKVLGEPPGADAPAYDAIIIGSGAAGSILAYRLAEAGRSVLVVERGPYADPSTFSDDEVSQYLRLYNEGAIQLAADFRLQVLQGMCVGGGTTVNNALCFDPPAAILDQWQIHGIDRPELEVAIATVRKWLSVAPIRRSAVADAATEFARAAQRLNLPGRIEVMDANISDKCVGCGYCNIGCAYGAKLSMLDTVLPWGQKAFGSRLQVLPDSEVSSIVRERGRAIGVRVRSKGDRDAVIRGKNVIISAGAIHSSDLLRRNHLGGARVGQGLYFNIASPLTAEFIKPVDAFAGIQMSHAYYPAANVPPFLLESWYNPPATQALAMPGWFEQHFKNMSRYRYMSCAASLVGTTSPGRVRGGIGGPSIEFKPSAADLRRVVEGLKLLGRIFFEAHAVRVMPATYAWHEFTSEPQLGTLDRYVRDNADLLLTSAHPQGGNAMGSVVDDSFAVLDCENVFLCDASVFPSGVHVNPQLTVMGMAQYAAPRILQRMS